MGIDKWIDLQLNPEPIPDPAGDDVIRNYSVFWTPTGDISHSSSAIAAPGEGRGRERFDDDEARGATGRARTEPVAARRRAQSADGRPDPVRALARAVSSERQLDEVMTDFWENHFSVFAGKGQTACTSPSMIAT